jgi:hypothetical protein
VDHPTAINAMANHVFNTVLWLGRDQRRHAQIAEGGREMPSHAGIRPSAIIRRRRGGVAIAVIARESCRACIRRSWQFPLGSADMRFQFSQNGIQAVDRF